MRLDEYTSYDAVGLAGLVAKGEVAPKQLAVCALDACEAVNPQINAVVEAFHARVASMDEPILEGPFAGVPTMLKDLFHGEVGTACGNGSRLSDGYVAGHEAEFTARIRRSGLINVGRTTTSEFGIMGTTETLAAGRTGTPWGGLHMAGGSSGGAAAVVAAGIVPMAAASDGGGSIRIPAAFCGLPGMKGTVGRIPRGPQTSIHPMTVVTGVMCRSIRDIARYYDVTSGYDSRDPYSLPKVEGWEHHLGSYHHDLRGKKVVITPDLGVAVVNPALAQMIVEAGQELARAAGLDVVDVPVQLPGLGLEWAIGNLASLKAELGDRWPGCESELTPEMAFGMHVAQESYSLDMMARSEEARTRANETLADVFDQVDFIFSATNPDVAFPANVGLNTRVGNEHVGPENNGALTIPYNIVGNPSLSLPVGHLDGLPVGMQVAATHHQDALLLDLGVLWERERPWPLVATSAPC